MRPCTLLLLMVVFTCVCTFVTGGRGGYGGDRNQRSRAGGPQWGAHRGGGWPQGRHSKKPRRPGGHNRAPPPDPRTRQGGHPQSRPRAGFLDTSLFQLSFGDGEQSTFSFSSDDISSLWDQVFGNSDSDDDASVATSISPTTTTTTAITPTEPATAATSSLVTKPWRGQGSFTGDLRLSCKDKGCRKKRGVVEVYNKEENHWGVICASKWDLKDAQVVCNYLQYSMGAKKFIRIKRAKAPKKSRHLPAFYGNVTCTGEEPAITECGGETVNTLECPKDRIAAVVCQGKLVNNTSPAVCDVGEQLCANQGRCIKPRWVCDGMSDCAWGTDEKNCGEENCNPNTFWCGVGGAGCISSLFVCDGDDDCTNNRDETNCVDHISHFTTTAGKKLPNSGATYKTGWRHASPYICAKKCREEKRFQCVSFDYNKALSECDLSTMSSRQLGLVTPSIGAANWVHYEMKTALNCAGFVCGDQCIPTGQVCDGVTQCLDGSDEKNCRSDGGPIPTDVIIRLKGGTSRFEGRLEIGTGSNFGLICDVGWTIREANVACRQLGFRRGALQALKGQFFARTSLPYKLSGVRCTGTEVSLDECEHSGWNQAICPMDHEAGVVCMTRNTVTPSPTTPVTTTRPISTAATHLPSGVPPAEPTCGDMPTHRLHIRTRVVGGNNADPGEWPWQVGIWLPWMFKCGGTLISSCWVLTAAHCFTPHYSPNSYIIRVGDHDAKTNEGTEQSIKITRIIFNQVNPYISSTNDNDIALLELAPVRGSTCAKYDDYVKPACIPTSIHQFPADYKCYITGWGQLSTTEQIPFSQFLQEAPVPLISKPVCGNYTIYGSSLSENMFCAGYLKGGIDTCQGDSGGPLQCYDNATQSFYVWGIVSWGHGCANARAPGIYTTVVNYRDWIRSVTGLNL